MNGCLKYMALKIFSLNSLPIPVNPEKVLWCQLVSVLKFVSVTIDQPDAVSAAKDWFKNNKCSWSLYIDSKQELFNKVLAVTENTSSAIPVCIVIDKNGKIVSFNSGFEADTYKDELINNIKLAEGN